MEELEADQWIIVKSENPKGKPHLVLMQEGESLGKIVLNKELVENINKHSKYKKANLLHGGIITLLLFLIFLVSFIGPIASSVGQITF